MKGVMAFVATLVHEFGHLLIGMVAGHRVLGLAVYPIELSLRPTRLEWVPRRNRRRLGGFIRFETAPWRMRDVAAMIVAGPLANALPAAIARTIGYGIGFGSPQGGEAIALAAISGAMMLANLLPFGTSDGAKLLGLLREVHHTRRELDRERWA